MDKIFDVAVIGAGPSGIGASIKLKEEGFDVVLIEKSMPGGKINIAPRVDNYPGFKEIPGPDLAMHFYQRILDNKLNFVGDEIVSLDKEDDLFIAQGKVNVYKAKAVYIASGTTERKMGRDNQVLRCGCQLLQDYHDNGSPDSSGTVEKSPRGLCRGFRKSKGVGNEDR